MLSMHSKFDPPDNIIDTPEKQKKFKMRYESLYNQMEGYIEESGYSDMVTINEIILGYMLVAYFEDIERLKNFHKVEHINSIKLMAYTIYWILRRKPIQILSNDKNLQYINERFALALFLGFLSCKDKGHIAVRTNVGLVAFRELLFYFFKFRQFNAQDIELVITSFFAGQIYQEISEDISDRMPPSDYETDPWDQSKAEN